MRNKRRSAHRLLHQVGDLLLFGGGQLLQRERRRPYPTLVEVGLVAEAERRVPRLELLRVLEEAKDLVALGVGGHAVPGPRSEVWLRGRDDRVDTLRHRAIRLL